MYGPDYRSTTASKIGYFDIWLNDIFYLEYVNFFESTKRNRVTIYNRWGDLVFEVEDYDNVTRVFRGVSNSGQELPSGTYFYRITFASSEPKREGYLSIRR